MKRVMDLAAAVLICASLSSAPALANESVKADKKNAPKPGKEVSAGTAVRQTAKEAAAAADFTLPGVDLMSHTLSASKGKEPVLLFFWTTWCPYCRKALKTVKEEQPALREANLRVYAVNVGEDPRKVAAFVKPGEYPFDILFDEDSAVAHQYGLVGVPTYFLIDKDGTIVYRGNYYPKDKFKQLLGS